MNWPGSGDPYYTAEGGVRKSFYGVTWVPWLVLNGNFTDTDISAVQNGYDNTLNRPGIASIVSSFTQNGTSMNINTTILPYYNLSNIKVFVAVFENKTTGNVGTNGETEFHHVMMKMVPDANGTSLSLTDRVPYVLNQSVNLAGTHVEDYNDLGVIVILQNNTTKEVYQSAYSLKNGAFANNSLLADLTIDGVTVPGFSPAQYVYNIELPYGTTEIPVVQATSADPGSSVIVLQSFTLPGTATVNVFAQNLQIQSNYSINFTVAEHIVLELKAYLEGPFNGTEMVNSLNLSGQIQLSQPYNVAPWNYEGTESVSTIPENVIDWVLIEIRDAASAANATSATRIGRQAGFILNNGNIVSTSGNPMLFATGVSDNLFVIVHHRNHLGILSSSGLTLSGGNYSYDFTTSFDQTYGGILGCKEISTGIWGMISGDADSDGMISPEDMNIFWYPTAGLPGYAPEDFNLDGQVNNPDKDDCWYNNIGKVCQVPE